MNTNPNSNPLDPEAIQARIKLESKTPLVFDEAVIKQILEEGSQALVKSVQGETAYNAEFMQDMLNTSGRGVEIAQAIINTIMEQHKIHPIKGGELALAFQISTTATYTGVKENLAAIKSGEQAIRSVHGLLETLFQGRVLGMLMSSFRKPGA